MSAAHYAVMFVVLVAMLSAVPFVMAVLVAVRLVKVSHVADTPMAFTSLLKAFTCTVCSQVAFALVAVPAIGLAFGRQLYFATPAVGFLLGIVFGLFSFPFFARRFYAVQQRVSA